ncbi:uncharacterized protein [Lepeophtheirus salmonis]|uniref:uncharacterized protein n=1 Tax=Lepeophtheirus salmonis TaxID=72036 RepID=UPI001AE901F6|nr:uncharacterized protein LOC121116405 [Lepeophtheirus salmonis]XP_040566594.1 uncharacterized protein LOC121116405 [Lepeophtheirus salmonis]
MNKFVAFIVLGSLLTQTVLSDGVHRGGRRTSSRRGREEASSSYGAPFQAENSYEAPPPSGYGAGTSQPTYDNSQPTYDNSQPSYDGELDTAANTAEGDALSMLEKSVPGIPGEDYPIFAEVPESGFECEGQVDGGYYADPEAQCQVFHICTADGAGSLAKYSFLCPNGTIFNQNYFICDWWFNFDCAEAEGLYSKNDEIAAEREALAAEAASSDYGSPADASYSAGSADAPLSGYGFEANVAEDEAPLDQYASYDSDRSGRSQFRGKNGRRFRN